MLKDFTDAQLQAELDRRKLEKIKADEPKMLPFNNFVPVQILCQDYINQLAEEGWVNGNLDHYIFEAAMEAVFGKDVWNWINEKLS